MSVLDSRYKRSLVVDQTGARPCGESTLRYSANKINALICYTVFFLVRMNEKGNRRSNERRNSEKTPRSQQGRPASEIVGGSGNSKALQLRTIFVSEGKKPTSSKKVQNGTSGNHTEAASHTQSDGGAERPPGNRPPSGGSESAGENPDPYAEIRQSLREFLGATKPGSPRYEYVNNYAQRQELEVTRNRLRDHPTTKNIGSIIALNIRIALLKKSYRSNINRKDTFGVEYRAAKRTFFSVWQDYTDLGEPTWSEKLSGNKDEVQDKVSQRYIDASQAIQRHLEQIANPPDNKTS